MADASMADASSPAGGRQAARGFSGELFDDLERLEGDSFWFRSRNKLIVWALRRYFPSARNLFEVGCGTGFVLEELARRFPGLALGGGDPFEEALAVARRRVPGAALQLLDARALPAGEPQDVVAAFDVLEHIEDDRAALGEMARVVRAGGGLLVTVPQHPALWSVADVAAHHQRRYRRIELLDRVRAAGFQPLRATSFTSVLLPAMAAARLWYRARPSAYSLERELDVPGPLDAGFEALMSAERALIRMGSSLPMGGSLLVVARRR